MTEAEKFKEGPMQATAQGPGVLINGIVRVSTVDTSWLGPALLPAGGLIIEGVHDSKESVQGASSVGEESDSRRGSDGSFSTVLAHILVEEDQSLDAMARARLKQWTAYANCSGAAVKNMFSIFHFLSLIT